MSSSSSSNAEEVVIDGTTELSFVQEEAEGATPEQRLIDACKNENEQLVLDILTNEAEIDINSADGIGNAAIHYGAYSGNATILKALINVSGIDLNLRNTQERNTGLHNAVLSGNAEMVTLLIEAGATAGLQNKLGQTAVALAEGVSEEMWMSLKATVQANKVSMDELASDDDDDEDWDSDEDQ